MLTRTSRLDQISAEKRALLLKKLRQKKKNQPSGIPRSPLRQRGSTFPLSASQQRLYFLNQLEPENPFYNEMVALRLHGEIDRRALEGALNEIIRRHEVLRSRFHTVEGEAVQTIEPFLWRPLPLIDLKGLSQDDREAEVARWLPRLRHQLFDLTTGDVIHARTFLLDARTTVLSLSCHHIVGDHWAISIVMAELSKLYDAFRQGLPSPLPELSVQYADFADWQHRLLMGDGFDKHIEYWREQLHEAPTVSLLPTDRPRSAKQQFRGSVLYPRLSGSLRDRLKAFGKERHSTLFMTLMAGFKALLYRYTGQPDLVVGSPTAGRGRVELEPLVGCFLNVVALRTRLSGRQSFTELLAQARETTLAAYEHQDLPFERLVEEVQVERDMSHEPVFQMMLNLMNLRMESLHLEGIEITPEPLLLDTVKIDLDLYLEERPDWIEGFLMYDVDLFDATTLLRFWRHYTRLLEAVVEHPEQKLDQVPLLDEAEIQQLGQEFGHGPPGVVESVPLPLSLSRFLADQAAGHPERIAVVDEDEALSYETLFRRAAWLAERLRSTLTELNGRVPRDELIAISVAKNSERVACWLAALRGGAGYLPLDPRHPEERRRGILTDAGVCGVLTDEPIDPGKTSVPVWQLDAWGEASAGLAADPFTFPEPDFDARQCVSYVIYTSGSTGKPKGVEIPQAALTNFIRTMAERPGLSGSETLLSVITPAFDMAVYEIYLSLGVGARVVLANRDEAASGEHLSRILDQSRTTMLQATPITWHLLLEVGHRFITGFKGVSGGDAMSHQMARGLLAAGVNLWNLYGPTETTVYSTRRPVPNVLQETPILPVGEAIDHTTLYIVDAALRPRPIGVHGELWIGGVGLARGYRGRPALTAERFVPDPFSTQPGERLYRSGDLLRFLPNGELGFLGRADFQVKIRGFRIELGEIESVLATHPKVDQAVVIVDPSSDRTRLVACWVRRGIAREPVELASFLRQTLPEYMVPGIFCEFQELPRTTSGKVDRKTLARSLPEESFDDSRAAIYQPPRTATEEILAGLYATLLERPTISAQDSFFDLGGHSLLAARLISRVTQTFDVEVPVRLLFERPRVTEFATVIDEARQKGRDFERPPLLPRTDQSPKELSFAQQRLWFLDRLEPNSSVYNMPAALRLIGELDVTALEGAFASVIERHESLRTTFTIDEEDVDGLPRQVVHPSGPWTLPVQTMLNEDERAIHERIQAESQRPFDLETGPLFRAQLLRLSPSEHVLLVNMHHIISDGWSVQLLVREVASVYQARTAGESLEPEALPIQYSDFAAWQRDWLQGEALEELLSFWRAYLDGRPSTLDLPLDRPRGQQRTGRGDGTRFDLDAPLSRRFAELCRRSGVTLFMGLATLLDTLLLRVTGERDLLLGTPVAGRDRFETEGLIGLFVNTLVLRADLSGDPSFGQALKRVSQSSLDAMAHLDLPFDRLVEEVQPERNLAQTPIFQVALIFQNREADVLSSVSWPGLDIEPLELDTQNAKFDLSWIVSETANGLEGGFEYAVDLFDRTTVMRLGRWISRLAEAVVENPRQRLSEFSLLEASEYQQLIREWNDTTKGFGPTTTLHDAIFERARQQSDGIAVFFPSKISALSYGELTLRARSLARQLELRGVRAGDRVLLHTERSLEMMIGLLAILDAGAAYVPLDPQHPEERLDGLIDELAGPQNPAIVLTQAHFYERLAADPRLAPMVLDGSANEPLEASIEAPTKRSTVDPSHLAYVIYTSGSTGRPKGVMNRHAGIVHRLRAMQATYRLNADDRVLQKTPLSFDVSVWECFWTLMAGATLVVARPDGHKDPTYLSATLDRERVSLLHFVPSMLQILLEALEPSAGRSVRQVITSGEALSYELEQRCLQLLSARLDNLYGPTEAAIDVTSWTARPAANPRPVPIGRPTANVRVILASRHLEGVTLGTAGELLIGGSQLARGYLDRPALTAERFVPNPWAKTPGERVYRTGDLVRHLTSGEMDYLGRIDHQVKIRGFRIELGEIEARIVEYPSVREVAVLARDLGGAEANLVAYLVVHEEVTGDLLRSWLAPKLPSHMVPSTFQTVEAFPLTSNGKLDRRALAALALPTESETPKAPPQTELQRQIAEIWQEVLGHEVGIHDNFFDVGGHSLLAVRVQRRLEKTLDRKLSLVTLFQQTTVAALAKFLSRAESPTSTIEQRVNRGGGRKAAMARRRKTRGRR